MDVAKETKLVKLSIRSDLTPNDLTEAEIKLADSGKEGKSALELMRKVAAAVQGLDDSIKLFKFALSNEPGTPKLLFTLELFSGPAQACQLTVPLDTTISQAFKLSVRSRKALERLHIDTIGQLIEKSGDYLLSEARNFGITSLTEIREKLAAVGGKLKGD